MDCTKEERLLRIDLAACYRILHMLRMTDTINTHIAVRIPGDGERFLINPYGRLFNEITASTLVAVDKAGRPEAADTRVNTAGFAIHAAVFKARPDAVCSLHTHTKAGVALSALKCGLLPISQFALYFFERVGYFDYRHISAVDDDCADLGVALGGNGALILRNHGLLTVGRSIAEAFLLTYYLDKACDVQLAAQASGQELVIPPEEECRGMASEVDLGFAGMAFGAPEWTALTRQLDAIDPSYRE